MKSRQKAIHLLAVSVGLAACGSPTSLTEPQVTSTELEGAASLVQTGDSVYWESSGVMQFEAANGDTLKYQRYGTQTAPYLVKVWKNGVWVGDVRPTWSGSAITSVKFQHGSDWIKTDALGEVIDTSEGMPSGGGGGGDDDILLAPSFDCKDLTLAASQCETELAAAATWGGMFVLGVTGTSALAAATYFTGNPIGAKYALAGAALTLTAGINTMLAGLSVVDCLI